MRRTLPLLSASSSFFLSTFLALAQSSSVAQVDPTSEAALVHLREQRERLFEEGGPQYGLLPALVAVGAFAAGDEQFGQELLDRLSREPERVVDRTARLATLWALSFSPPQGADWTPFVDRSVEWLEDVQVDQMGISRRRGGLLGRAVPAGQRSRRTAVASVTELAAWAVCLRSMERLGFTSGPPDEKLPMTWAQAARTAEDVVKGSGSGRRGRSSKASDPLAPACASLVLALARPALIHATDLNRTLLDRHGEMDEALDSLLDRVASSKDADGRARDWDVLLTAAVLSRLSWAVGERAVPDLRDAVRAMAMPDGSVRCVGKLSLRVRDDEGLEAFHREPRARLLSTALAVIALNGAGRRRDEISQYSSFARSASLLQGANEEVRERLEELFRCDEQAAWFAMIDAWFAESEELRDTARRLLVQRAQWDFGQDRDAPHRAERWFQHHAREWQDSAAWQTWLGRALACLLGNEDLDSLGQLWTAVDEKPERYAADVLLALGDESEATRTGAHLLLQQLGAPDVGYDPGRGREGNRAEIEALARWLAED